MPIGTEGARLRGYEHIVDIEVVRTPRPALAVGGGLARTCPAKSATAKRPILALLQPGDRAPQRCHAQLLRHRDGRAAGEPSTTVEPGPPAHLGRDQLPLPGTGYSVVDGETHRLGGRRPAALRPGLGRARPPLGLRRASRRSPCRTTPCRSAWSRWSGRRRWTARCSPWAPRPARPATSAPAKPAERDEVPLRPHGHPRLGGPADHAVRRNDCSRTRADGRAERPVRRVSLVLPAHDEAATIGRHRRGRPRGARRPHRSRGRGPRRRLPVAGRHRRGRCGRRRDRGRAGLGDVRSRPRARQGRGAVEGPRREHRRPRRRDRRRSP